MAAGIDGSARSLTGWNHVRAVLLLPFMNTVVIPSCLLLWFDDGAFGLDPAATDRVVLLISLLLLATGLFLVVRSILLFVRHGRGTLAPWDPTTCLLTHDIYRYTRNPMKLGLFLVLSGETLLLRSPAVAVWSVAFIAMNVLYINWFEEPGLSRRFGDRYRAYCRRVPRWVRLGANSGSAAGTGQPLS